MSATLSCISGFRSKGPASFLLEAAGRRILLDFGCGPDNDALPDFARIGDVDALVLSHGHRDHVGALPFLGRIGSPPVFATRWLLARLPGIVDGVQLPLRGEAEVLGLRVQTGRNGHAPGGIWLRFETGGGLLYTGDYCPSSLLYAYDKPPLSATAVVDASYGDDDRPLSQAAQSLLEIAGRGPCLLPAPPDGRGPEIARFLFGAGLNVGLDETTAHAIQQLLADPSSLSAGNVADLQRLLASHRRLDAASSPAGAMVVAGASGNSGLARQLLERWKTDSKVGFIFTGHLAVGSPAEQLVRDGRATSLRWNVHPRLSETRDLLAEVGALRVIPAFAGPDKLAALRCGLTTPFDTEGDIVAIA